MNKVIEELPTEISEKLFDYQQKHVKLLMKPLQEYGRALDMSDTGTGKTYTSIALCMLLGLKPFIICPKSVLKSWLDTLKYFNCEFEGLVNYESLQNCMYYPANSTEKVRCPFITKKKRYITKMSKGKLVKKEKIEYEWKTRKNMCIIFDEVHKCKNRKTVNAAMLLSLSETSAKILMLSATAADKPEFFVLVGYTLGLYNDIKSGKNWIESAGAAYNNTMMGVNRKICPTYASRMKIKDLGALFPENNVKAELFESENEVAIQEQYKLIEEAVAALQKKEDYAIALARLMYARMKIETLKIPIFLDLARKELAKGNSVVIIVNFTQNLLTLADELKTKCIIYGEQTIDQRNANIDDFNNNKQKCIVVNLASGGVGISLHDKNGGHPRVCLISPSYSAIQVLQALGRICRAGTKSEILQLIVYCKNTVEVSMCELMKDKIINISCLNDGATNTYKITNFLDDDGSNNQVEEAEQSEYEKLFMRINVLNAKRDRIKKDLTDTENEIKALEIQLEYMI